MSLLDSLKGSRMPAVQRFVRLRATPTDNPYNPAAPSRDWTSPGELEFTGAFASSSSTVTRDELDTPVDTRAVLTTTMPGLDIRSGDRIRNDPDDGRVWTVTGVPAQDINPFTGWQPSMELILEEVTG